MIKKIITPIVIFALGAAAVYVLVFWKTKSLEVAAGDEVSQKSPAAQGASGRVHMSAVQIREFGIETALAGPGRLKVEVVLPGEIVMNADRVAHVVPRVSGVVRDVRKNLGDTVMRGEIMAVLESRELADATAVLLAARERIKLSQNSFDREEQLWKKKISPEQDYIQARNALAEAGIELRTSEQKLRALGFSDEYITKLPDRPGQTALLYEMIAPYDATIIEKHISLGEVLKEESSAFVIADLSSVWVNLDVHQKDLPLIQVGQKASIGIGNSGPAAEAEINFLEPIAEETNRTIHARVVLPNTGGKWRPGMFVTGRIAVDDIRVPILVPNEALLMFGGKNCVFIKDGEDFNLREITPGRTNGTLTEILRGLQAGQTFVAKGAFTLKSELGKPEEEK
jgi:membrane fusion protein, heavy metal efflux system